MKSNGVMMREEKSRLERAAMLMFLRALRLNYGRELHIWEQRERPDFVARGPWGKWVGVEITHLYHNEEEARYLNGRAPEGIHPLTSVAQLVDALNRSLQNKALRSYGYEAHEELILLIRVPSPEVQKSVVMAHRDQVSVPESAFDEIWMLFYDYDHLDWADLLRLDDGN
jgi:hypothetical protein